MAAKTPPPSDEDLLDPKLTRRNFLKTAGAGAVATSVAGMAVGGATVYGQGAEHVVPPPGLEPGTSGL